MSANWQYRAVDDPLLPFTQPTQYGRLLQQLIVTWPGKGLPPPIMPPPFPDFPILNNIFMSDPSLQQHQQQDQAYGGSDEDTEDYDPGQDYDEGEIFEGDAQQTAAVQQLPAASKPLASASALKPSGTGKPAEKEDQVKRLQDLRAQLLAQKGTPKLPNTLTPPTEPANMRKSTPAPAVATSKGQPSGVILASPDLSTIDLERLVAQGKAAAAAQDLKDKAAKTTSGSELEQHKKLQELSSRLPSRDSKPKMAEKGLPEVKATNTQDNESSARQLPKNGTTTDEPQSSHSFRRGSNTANDRVDEAAAASANPPSTSGAPPVDSHYYKDLPEWLEVTGYHNIEYRQAKLARYQKIQQLAAEMEKIKQEDPTSFEIWQARNAMPPPPLPQRYTSSIVGNQMATPNDTPPGTATPAGSEKRQRSPLSSRTADAPPRKAARTEPVESEEYRDRHDRDSRSSPRSLEHRISAASEDAPRARGPTATERRQSYDDRLNGCYPSYDRYYDDRYSRDSRGYDQYAPRAPNGGREQQQHRGQGQKQTGFRGKRGK